MDIQQLVAKAQYLLGLPGPDPDQRPAEPEGRGDDPARALRDVKAYAFHGDLTLTGASIDRVDFGRLGVADRPGRRRARVVGPARAGWSITPTAGRTTRPSRRRWPSPRRARCRRAASARPSAPSCRRRASSRSRSTATSSRWASWPRRPCPGRPRCRAWRRCTSRRGPTSARPAEPEAWTVSGQVESRQITYRGAVLDRVATRFALKDGKLDVPSFAADAGRPPLSARGGST